MLQRPPRSTRTDTLVPNTTLCRSRARRTECQRGAAPFDLGRGAFALRQHARDMGSGIERHEGEVAPIPRSEEHTSELQSLMRNSYAVFCLKKKTCTYKNQISTYSILVTSSTILEIHS